MVDLVGGRRSVGVRYGFITKHPLQTHTPVLVFNLPLARTLQDLLVYEVIVVTRGGVGVSC